MKDPICNPSTWQAEAGGSLQVQNQPGLHGETLYSKQNKTKPNLYGKRNYGDGLDEERTCLLTTSPTQDGDRIS